LSLTIVYVWLVYNFDDNKLIENNKILKNKSINYRSFEDGCLVYIKGLFNSNIIRCDKSYIYYDSENPRSRIVGALSKPVLLSFINQEVSMNK